MKRRTFLISSFAFLISHFSFLICNAMQVQTDRAWYLVGEKMTVSVTADDARIAYAELSDTQGLVAGVIVDLMEGVGEGGIELPVELHSGYYVLSVYTRSNANIFHQLVAVVNPLRKSADDDIEWVGITHPDSLSYPVSSTLDVQPSMVNGQWSTVNGQWSTVNGQWSMFNIPEIDSHVIMARVKNVYNGHTFSSSEIRPSLSIVGKQIHYFEGKMVNDSIAVFYTFGIHGRHPLVLSAMSSTTANSQRPTANDYVVSLPIEMISPFVSLIPKKLPHLVFHYKRSEVEARSLDMQRRHSSELKVHSSQPTANSQPPLEYDDTVFGTKPDLSYNLDEYRQFRTIREVLLEYVSCVRKVDGQWSTANGQWSTRLIVRKEQEVYNSSLPTLVLIDGMPVSDTERLLDYDARRVHYINIYGGQYIFGNGVYNGILSFVTRSGQLTNYPTEPNMQYLMYEFPR